MTTIDKETVKCFKVGHIVVGTTAVQLAPNASLPFDVKKGILVKAPGVDDTTPNTAPVFIGTTAGVTADYDANTGGFPLAPGESIVIPVSEAGKMWLISSAVSQDLAWILT